MFQRIHKHLEVDLNCLHFKIPRYLEILSVSNEERTPTSIYISPQCLLPKVRVISWVLSLVYQCPANADSIHFSRRNRI